MPQYSRTWVDWGKCKDQKYHLYISLMNTLISKKIAFILLIILLTAVVCFHLCIMVKLIPYNIAWGGRLENDLQMYIFETISILLNIILISALFLKNRVINHQLSDRVLNSILWFFISIFSLNTIGNLFAKTNFEKFFAILTLVFALLIWVIVKRNKGSDTTEMEHKN